jgi:Ala-tRNA(Pro) deacylase
VEDTVQSTKTEVTDRIEKLLRKSGVVHQIMQHEPVFTSEEAALVRGTRPEEGAKALVVKADDDRFYHVVIAGHLRVDNAKLRQVVGTRRVRFANDEELLRLTGCVRGAVPPFGNLFGLPVLMDESLRACEQIAFNAGSNAVSIVMRRDEFEQIVQPQLCDLSLSAESE